jgi:hypothetical protein
VLRRPLAPWGTLDKDEERYRDQDDEESEDYGLILGSAEMGILPGHGELLSVRSVMRLSLSALLKRLSSGVEFLSIIAKAFD